jgi:tetratricopeptide (TPR) repeat protein
MTDRPDNIAPEFELPMHMPLDELAGPAARLSRERAAAMVDAALVDFAVAPASATRTTRTLLRQPSAAANSQLSRAVVQWASAAAALLALVGGAAAARYYFHFTDEAPQKTESKVSAPTAAPKRPQPTAATPEQAAPIPASEPFVDKPARTAAPEDLLQRANQQRAAGQFRAAAQSYALVYERFPKSLSAYVARIAGAALELEHLEQPAQARKLFERALHDQPRGALDLEARQGLAAAVRKLNDTAAERRVLKALIAAHTDSPAARRADERLRELGSE